MNISMNLLLTILGMALIVIGTTMYNAGYSLAMMLNIVGGFILGLISAKADKADEM